MSTFAVEMAQRVTTAIVHLCVRLNFGDDG